MNSARSYLAELLRALGHALPPDCDPALRYERRGTEVAGFVDELCIKLPGPVTVYLEDRDLGRPIDELAAEVAGIYKRGLEEIEHKRREFDQRIGDAG